METGNGSTVTNTNRSNSNFYEMHIISKSNEPSYTIKIFEEVQSRFAPSKADYEKLLTLLEQVGWVSDISKS